MTITTAPALASFADTPSVTSALCSPDVLVRETLAGRPGNLAAVTGARGSRILGAIYPR